MQNPSIASPPNHRSWLPSIHVLAGLLLLQWCLAGCAKAADTTPQPTVSFNISWNDPQHANLKTTGGYTEAQGVLIAHVKDGSFVAVSVACTFEGTKLVYRLSSNQFYCATDGSTFDLQGKPVGGPATKPLTLYNVISSKSTAGLFTITN